MPRTRPCDKELRVSEQPLAQSLPGSGAANAAEGRAKGGGAAGGNSAQGWISQHCQDEVTAVVLG